MAKALVCDGLDCNAVARDTRMPVGWVQLAIPAGARSDPRLMHFHSVPCLQDFLDRKFDPDTQRILD